MTEYAVIMAGGSGERFWPVSRVNRPKQLLKLAHPSQTLLEEAVDRMKPLVGRDRILIATGLPLVAAVRSTDLVPSENVLAEPSKRNTLGCLCWVAANLLARHPEDHSDVAMAVLTADHKIGEPVRFRDTVRRALDAAEATSGLVTIGMKPTRPETGFGYIELGSELEPPLSGVYRVACFREKPDMATATEYVESGRFRWNAGMFFWMLDAFLHELEIANPDAAEVVRAMGRMLAAGDQDAAVDEFDKLPNKSVDYALLELSKRVFTQPADFPWDDVGSWDALERTLPSDGNVSVGDNLLVDCQGTIAYNDDPNLLVTAVGVEDLVIVAAQGVVMVCRKAEAQRVKEILQRLPTNSPLR